MRVPTPSTRDLERSLLQRGIGDLVAGRPRCSSCERTPLVGERVHEYDGEGLLCDLCRAGRPDEPVSSRRLRSAEFGQAPRSPLAA
jgi:hypothetical protein